MPTFDLAFLVAHARELTPPFEVAGYRLAPLSLRSDSAFDQFKEELGQAGATAVGVGGDAVTVTVTIEAPDEDQAIATAYQQARRILEPFGLLDPEDEAFNLARFRPEFLPNALTINKQAKPPVADFRSYDRSRLARLNLGPDATTITSDFNNRVIRRIGALYPKSLVDPSEPASPVDLRVARAVHWYSQAEGLHDETLVFVCYWIGLEALVLKSSTTTHKKVKFTNRINKLCTYHTPEVDWLSVSGDLWDKRADIVHEAFGASHESVIPEISAEDINAVRYIFVLTVLYVLEVRANGVSLDGLWNPANLDSYSPGAILRWEQMPAVYHILSQQRRREVV
jgi:hypothetical protein